MNNSIINKIQDVKDAIKNSEQILTNYLQQVQELQNARLINQKRMGEIEKLISESKIQQDLLKKKNAIIQTNIEHIQNKPDDIEKIKNSYLNSLNINKQAKEQHQDLQSQIQEIKTHNQSKPDKMNSIMCDFEEIQTEKQMLTNKFNELKNFQEDYFEITNKYETLIKHEESLQSQLVQFKLMRENQEKQINLLKSENEKYKESISKNKNESISLTKRIQDIENQLYSKKNDISLSQISNEFVDQIQNQILLTDDQINLLKVQQNSIEESLNFHCEDHEYLKSIDTDELEKKAEEMQKELDEDKNALFLLLREREELMDNDESMKYCTNENYQKLSYLQKLRDQLQKMKDRDPIYQKEIYELRCKSEKLETDLNLLEKCMMRKKAEKEEYAKRIQNDQDLKIQHESRMEQIQSRFKPESIKINKGKIDSLHKENKVLMQKILKFADSLGPAKVKKKKVVKKQPFIL